MPAVPIEGIVERQPGGAARHRLAAEVAFRETAGVAGRITRVQVAVLDDSTEPADSQAIAVDLEVPASGSVTYPVSQSFEIGRAIEQGRWRISGTGVDADGRAFDLRPLDVPLRFRAMGAPPEVAAPVTFVGAGDIAVCGSVNTEATARLLDVIAGTVFTLGDNAYPNGTFESFRDCYDPTWGRHRSRTRPSPGNHDWHYSAGAAYFQYFGASAGPPGLGYYSYTLGAWHVVSLNSNVSGRRGAPQWEWVRADLAANPATCTLAYWHHPLFSSGPNGSDGNMRDVWRLLHEAGAELVLSGHDHDYERFAPQDADGRPDPTRGIREIVVGTGGYPLYQRRGVLPNSEVLDDQTWGVLKLTLQARSYDWEFIPIGGQSFRDFGRAACVP